MKISVFFSVLMCLVSFSFVEVYEVVNNLIIIDPGHGGMDTGAVVENVYESNLVLDISKKIEEVLENAGYDVILTRNNYDSLSGDKFIKKVDMQKRVNIINQNNARLALSIHLNKFSIEKYHGAQIFYNNNIVENKELASSLQEKFNNYLGNTNRNIVSRNDVYLLNRINIPCCLIECGFMSNPDEFELLQKEEYQYKLAFAILLGINDFFD